MVNVVHEPIDDEQAELCTNLITVGLVPEKKCIRKHFINIDKIGLTRAP